MLYTSGEAHGLVFLSYSRKDRDFADNLASALAQRQITVWVDTKNIVGGKAWSEVIVDAIKTCDAFLVLLSPQYVTSSNVENELRVAGEHKRLIIPVVYQECEVPASKEYYLAGLQKIDFSAGLEDGMDRLVNALAPPGTVPRQAAYSERPLAAAASSAGAAIQLSGFPSPDPGPYRAAPLLPWQELQQFLCGSWNVEIQISPVFPISVVMLQLLPNGIFTGQIDPMMGGPVVNGMWQVTPQGQLTLNGVKTLGWQSMPYITMITFTQRASPALMQGVTTGGEQVTWHRTG